MSYRRERNRSVRIKLLTVQKSPKAVEAAATPLRNEKSPFAWLIPTADTFSDMVRRLTGSVQHPDPPSNPAPKRAFFETLIHANFHSASRATPLRIRCAPRGQRSPEKN